MGMDPFYGPVATEAAGTAGILLIFMAVYYLLIFGFSILSYVLHALGMYTIAKRRGIHNPWLAWVPIGNLWILGSISDQYQYVAQGKVRSRRKLLLGLMIALAALMLVLFVVTIYLAVQAAFGGAEASVVVAAMIALFFGLIMMVVAILMTVFEYICLYNLFASCDPDNKVTYLLLSIFISVTMPFLVFVCRKKDLGMPPRKPDPVVIDPPAFEG